MDLTSSDSLHRSDSFCIDDVPLVDPEFLMCPSYLKSTPIHHGDQVGNAGDFMNPSSSQNYPGASSGGILNQANGNMDNLSHSPNTANSPALRERLSENEKRVRKRNIDRAYRRRVKNNKVQMGLDLKRLGEENNSLKTTNQSLLEENASMNRTLTNQQNTIHQLQNDLSLVKHHCEKLDAQLKSLTLDKDGPLGIEIEKLKAENDSLRKNANHNSNVSLLLEIEKLTNENKVLKVHNDALCVKILSLNEKMPGQEP